MAKEKINAATQKVAATKEVKEVFFTAEDKTKYQVLGNDFRFQGYKYTALEAVKNEKLMNALIASGAPSIKKV